MHGWDWLWMTFMMGFWLLLIGGVVYAAVRFAQRLPARGNCETCGAPVA